MFITIFLFSLQVGKAMSSNESAAFEIMKSLDVDYVLIIFGGVIGYSGDDINKFLWMVRIAEGEHPKDIRVCFHGNRDRVVGCTRSIIYSSKPWKCFHVLTGLKLVTLGFPCRRVTTSPLRENLE